MKSPFDIPEPLLIGMSGGKTSAYQLRRFLDHFGGKISGKRAIVFANTGHEDERTLKFVERVSIEWDAHIYWVEYRFVPFPDAMLADPEFRLLRRRQLENRGDKVLREEIALRMETAGFPENAESIRRGRECLNGKSTYEIVNFATASRKGEPFQMMLEARAAYRQHVKDLPGVVPNPAQRICTGELKIKAMGRFAADLWGVDKVRGYNIALALRADEFRRVESAESRDVEGGIPFFPLFDAGVRGPDIVSFWQNQPFQLPMKSYEGNCRLCFMKRGHAVERLIYERPNDANWWIDWEHRTGDRFRRDRDSYSAMKWRAENQRLLLLEEPGEIESVISCEGGYCSD